MVDKETLEYWADYHVGGSGLSISLQKLLKNMAAELLQRRAAAELFSWSDITGGT